MPKAKEPKFLIFCNKFSIIAGADFDQISIEIIIET